MLVIFLLSAAMWTWSVTDTDQVTRLPTGMWLDPAGQSFDVGNMPLNVILSPQGNHFVLSLNGWREQGVQVIERATGRIVQTLVQPGAFLGLAFSPDGRMLYASGGNEDVVYCYNWLNGRATPTDNIVLAQKQTDESATRFPAGLAMSRDGRRLYVAENISDSLAIIDVASKQILQRLKTDHYPYHVAVAGDGKIYVSAWGGNSVSVFKTKRVGSVASAGKIIVGRHPSALALNAKGSRLFVASASTDRIAVIDTAKRRVIKENRTYDQIFGDLSTGDGDAGLLFFSEDSTPNHRALAERFGLFDRFFVNAEVSQQGHQWSTAAYVTDYTEKTTPSIYSNRRAMPSSDGDEEDPVNGYLWDAAVRKGITLRNYGEFVMPGEPKEDQATAVPHYSPIKTSLAPYTNPEYPGYDLNITDQKRADVWIKELEEFVGKGELPALEIVWLPGDHTAGAQPGQRTPAAFVADNDLALGRMVAALSRTPFWKDTIIFVLEDDAQDGPDHVDSHRSVLMVISPYNRAGTYHRFVNTTDIVATIEEILGIEPLSQFDYYGRPLREIFTVEPDLRPYEVLNPGQSLVELNPPKGQNAEASLLLNLSKEDVADMNLFNRILWRVIKGDGIPYPSIKQMSSLEYMRGR
jgi:YVTN family beta-propeller protein